MAGVNELGNSAEVGRRGFSAHRPGGRAGRELLDCHSESEREPMRQGQQNRRGRGRNNNQNRKTQNPLTRSFESTGPDVKVRGTPAHIAEKYMSLARDAQSSGDPVLAENYLQHAEHYNRIILTFREQQMSQGNEFNPNMPRPQPFNAQEALDEELSDEEAAAQGEDAGQNGPVQGAGDQPNVSQRNFEGGQRYENRQQRHNNFRQDRGDRGDRGERFNRQDRGERPDRAADREAGSAEGANGNGQRRREPYQGDRQGNRQPGGFGTQPAVAAGDDNEQPAFLRRPVRRSRQSEENAPEARQQAVADEQE